MTVYSYIVLETDIHNGDIDAARVEIAKHSLGAVYSPGLAPNVHESISLEPGNLQVRLPLEDEYFRKHINWDISQFVFNDGPVCPTCNRPNEDQRNVNPQVHSESRSLDGRDG